MKRTIIFGLGAGLALSGALLVGCEQTTSTVNNTTPTPTPVVTPSVPATHSSDAHNAEDAMPRIAPADAIQLSKSNQAIIIDVRGTDIYNTAHVKGSIDFALTRLESGDFTGLPRDKKIIALCA
jgi:hypothetical protein